MRRRLAPLVLMALVVAGCATQYVYYGHLDAEDSDGVTRDHIVYWLKTERRFWFDGVEGAVRLLTECMPSTIVFDETADGIVFRRTPNDEGVFGDVAMNGPCGRVLTAKTVKELPAGVIRIEIYCRHAADEFDVGVQKAYLKARDTPYEFTVVREPSDHFPGGAPRFECPGD